MGPCCKFCDRRCSVWRTYPTLDGWRSILMATCARGMAHDREQTGYNAASAVNPMTDPRFPSDSSEQRVSRMTCLIIERLGKAEDQGIRIYPNTQSYREDEIIVEFSGCQPGMPERIFRIRVEEVPMETATEESE
jgi:hypothetical protein